MSRIKESTYFKGITRKELEAELGLAKVRVEAVYPIKALKEILSDTDYSVGIGWLRGGKVRYIDPDNEYDFFSFLLEEAELRPVEDHAYIITNFEDHGETYTFSIGLYHDPIIERDELEILDEFLEDIRNNARYWHKHIVRKYKDDVGKEPTILSKAIRDVVEGVTFSFLSYADGCSGANFHGLKIFAKDKYREDEDNPWVNLTQNTHLHDHIYPIFEEESDNEN